MCALGQERTRSPKENESQVPGMATLQPTEAWVLRASAQLWLHQNLVYVIQCDKSVRAFVSSYHTIDHKCCES